MATKTIPSGPVQDWTRFHPNNTAGLAQKSLDKSLKEEEITADDVHLIPAYIRWRKHKKTLQVSTQNKIQFYILMWRRESPPFKDLTLDGVYSALEKFTDTAEYKKNTAHTIFGVVRPFLLWLIAKERSLLAIRTQKQKRGDK